MYTYLFADCFPGGFQETSSTPKTSSFPLLDEWFLLKVSISVECKLSSIFFNAKFPWNLTVLFTKVAQKIMSVYFHSNWTECYTFLLSSWLSAKDAIIKQTRDWLKLSQLSTWLSLKAKAWLPLAQLWASSTFLKAERQARPVLAAIFLFCEENRFCRSFSPF